MIYKKKRAIVLSTALVVVFSLMSSCLLYFSATKHSNSGGIFSTAKGAVEDWGAKSNETYFAFETENFYVEINDSGNVLSARKDTLFWVRDRLNSFSKKEINAMFVSSNDEYIYMFTELLAKKMRMILNLLIKKFILM